MSFLKKLFPFLFKSESNPSSPKSAAKTAPTRSGNPSTTAESSVIVAYGIVARAKNARGLRRDSKVYVRSILEDGDRLRIRGLAPNGKKVTLTVPRRTLKDYQSEGVPEHLAKHYDKHSLFQEEHEAKMKAEALGKH